MKKVIMIMFAIALMVPMVSGAETINIVSDEWCPYNCVPGSDRPGFGIEIAMEAYAPHDIQVNYTTQDWDAAVEDTKNGKFHAVISAYKEDAPGFVFPENEFGVSGNAFFVRKGDSWKYTNTDSMNGKKIGLIEGYAYGEVLDKYFADNAQNIFYANGDRALDSLMEKLVKNEIDVVCDDPFVFQLRAKELYLSKKVSHAGEEGEPLPLYVAYSPALPGSQELADKLSEGIDKLRANGRLQAILKKYGLSDWR